MDMKPIPRNGKCCACDYQGSKETECKEREDATHCNHWWDGPSAYVDEAIHPWRGRMWCHLISDTVEELHQFAKMLGLKKSWFQDKTTPHYDITENKRKLAISMGAIPLERRDFVSKMRELRKSAAK